MLEINGVINKTKHTISILEDKVIEFELLIVGTILVAKTQVYNIKVKHELIKPCINLKNT